MIKWRRASILGAICAGLIANASAAQTADPKPQPAQDSTAKQTPGTRLPVEAFAQLPFVDEAQLSPDGTHLAGLFAVQGRQVLAINSLFDPSEKPVHLIVPEDTQASWIRWVNDDNILVGLYALVSIDSGSDRWTVTRMIGINRKTGKVTRTLWDKNGQNSGHVVWVASDGSPVVLAAAQSSIYVGEDFWPAIYRVNVETGRSIRTTKGHPGVMNWHADAAGTIRSGVGYNDSNRQFRLLYRGEGRTNDVFKVVDTADSRKDDYVQRPLVFLPGTDHALVLHDNAKGLTAIYEVDLVTQEDVRTFYEAPNGGEISGAIMSANGKELLGVYLDRGDEDVHWFDPVLAGVQKDLNQSVAPRRARVISMSADHTKLLIIVDRPNSPGALYYFDVTDSKMQRVAMMNPALGARTLAPVKVVNYTARDGTPIEAILTLPGDRPAKNLPIIMLPHGGPWAQDTPTYDYWSQFLASRGYAVLQPNFRGSTGYGTAFTKAGEGQMGLAMQDDVTDGLAWAVKEGIADPARACIVGASYGGYAAMWGIAKDPKLYRCAISIAGVSNLRREVNDFGGYLMGGKYKDDWKRMTPDFAAVSPINAVDRIEAPLLLIHGKKDITVDYKQSTTMNDKMKAAGRNVELVILPEADHYFTRQDDRLVLLTSMEKFLAKYNPADPAPENDK